MSSTNQSPHYQRAELMFLQAKNDQDKLKYLEEMIKECPKHKGAEKMLAQLRTRRKKLLERLDKNKKKGKSGSKDSIKKEELQAVIVGFTNTGKSSLISSLTNASPKIAPYDFTTKKPIVGMMDFSGVQIQTVEIPAFESDNYDKGVVYTADVILILVDDLNQIQEIKKEVDEYKGRKLIVFNLKEKVDKRKLEATMKSKRYDFLIISTKTKENLDDLKERIFQLFSKIRIFTKEPGKEKSKRPMILEEKSIVKNVAEKVLKNMDDLKETKIWGPSSKFPGQKVGINHVLRDLDVVEFRTR